MCAKAAIDGMLCDLCWDEGDEVKAVVMVSGSPRCKAHSESTSPPTTPSGLFAITPPATFPSPLKKSTQATVTVLKSRDFGFLAESPIVFRLFIYLVERILAYGLLLDKIDSALFASRCREGFTAKRRCVVALNF